VLAGGRQTGPQFDEAECRGQEPVYSNRIVVEQKCLHAAREQAALSKLSLHVVSKGSDSDKILRRRFAERATDGP